MTLQTRVSGRCFLFMFHVCLCIAVLCVPCSLVAFLCVMFSCVFVTFSYGVPDQVRCLMPSIPDFAFFSTLWPRLQFAYTIKTLSMLCSHPALTESSIGTPAIMFVSPCYFLLPSLSGKIPTNVCPADNLNANTDIKCLGNSDKL